MPKHIEFCIPTAGKAVPSGPDWIHEVKYDGYRVRLERDGDRVRLFTKGGHDWTDRYPWIAETALKIRKSQFIIDGEAVVLNVDGVSDFNALHSRKYDHEVQLYAFDILAYDGDDLRRMPLHLRKSNLAQISAAGRRASSSPRSSRERSGQIFSRRHAAWALRDWSPSTALAPTASADVTIGSR